MFTYKSSSAIKEMKYGIKSVTVQYIGGGIYRYPVNPLETVRLFLAPSKGKAVNKILKDGRPWVRL